MAKKNRKKSADVVEVELRQALRDAKLEASYLPLDRIAQAIVAEIGVDVPRLLYWIMRKNGQDPVD